MTSHPEGTDVEGAPVQLRPVDARATRRGRVMTVVAAGLSPENWRGPYQPHLLVRDGRPVVLPREWVDAGGRSLSGAVEPWARAMGVPVSGSLRDNSAEIRVSLVVGAVAVVIILVGLMVLRAM